MVEVTRAPLHLEPRLVPKPWGGRRLADFGHDLPENVRIGESWEVADLAASATDVEQPVTPVATGPLAGRTLQEVIALDPGGLLGDAADLDGRFPLLVKLLDARENLSVQVHPPATYVAEHPGVALKTESWVVLAADADAELLLGVEDGVTPDDLAPVLGTKAMLPMLRRVPVRAGDVHHLPAGTIHALTAGVVVAEVQTPSDTTFRIYDWTEEYGREPRVLNLEAARRSIELGWEHNLGPFRPVGTEGLASRVSDTSPDTSPAASQAPSADPAPDTRRLGSSQMLVETTHYRLVRRNLAALEAEPVEVGTMRVIQVLGGTLRGDGFAWDLTPGGTVVLPASWSGTLRAVEGPASWLETTVPAR